MTVGGGGGPSGNKLGSAALQESNGTHVLSTEVNNKQLILKFLTLFKAYGGHCGSPRARGTGWCRRCVLTHRKVYFPSIFVLRGTGNVPERLFGARGNLPPQDPNVSQQSELEPHNNLHYPPPGCQKQPWFRLR